MRRFLAGLAMLMLTALSAGAQTLPIPLFSGPSDPSQMRTYFNNLILSINAILVPALGATTTSAGTAVNLISLTGGITGSNAVIGLQAGADTNAGITINPNGSGNIVLFSQYDTGVLQFGNQTGFTPATSLIACPGVQAGKAAPLGVSATVTGFTPIKDWLGRVHAWPAC